MGQIAPFRAGDRAEFGLQSALSRQSGLEKAAAQERLTSPALRGFMRKVRWNDGLGRAWLPPKPET